jgi:C-terminal processing protease CtpA/Prc
MGEVFRRCAHSLGKILRVSSSKSQPNLLKNGDIMNETLSAELSRDQEILTEDSCQRRTVIITRDPEQSFGFSLQSVLIESKDENVQDARITFVSKVESGSPSDKAGVLVGDVIVAIDGEIVVDYAHSDLISLIQTKTQMRVILLFENMARKVQLIAQYTETEKLLAEKRQQLAEVEEQIEGIICRRSQGSKASASDDGVFDDYSESSRYSIRSLQSFDFDEASVQFC